MFQEQVEYTGAPQTGRGRVIQNGTGSKPENNMKQLPGGSLSKALECVPTICLLGFKVHYIQRPVILKI